MMTPNTLKARMRVSWLAPDPTVVPWNGVDAMPTHRTEIPHARSCVALKTTEGRTLCWIESADERGPIAELSGFVRYAPPGIAVLGMLSGKDFMGLSVLGDAGDYGGPQRWAESSVEDHFAVLVKSGVAIAPTKRSRMELTPEALEADFVKNCLEDPKLSGYWMRSTGLGTWQQWRPLFGIDLITTESYGLVTREGYPVCKEYHGYAAGYLVSTTYRGVSKGRITDRGDVTASTEQQADDLHTDERFVRYWHGPKGQAELKAMAEQ